MKKLGLLLLILLMAFSANAKSKKGVTVYVELSPAGSFEIKGKVKGKVRTKGGQLFADKITTKVKNLKTGLDLRDKHTKEKLEYKKFPKIEVTNAKGSNGKGTGTINVKGIKKKISFTYKETGKYIKAKFNLSLKDFNFSGIKYLGVGVKDKVRVEAVVPFKK